MRIMRLYLDMIILIQILYIERNGIDFFKDFREGQYDIFWNLIYFFESNFREFVVKFFKY